MDAELGFCLQPPVQDISSGLIPAPGAGGLQVFPRQPFLFILVDLADFCVNKWMVILPPFLFLELLSFTTSESQEGRARRWKDGER